MKFLALLLFFLLINQASYAQAVESPGAEQCTLQMKLEGVIGAASLDHLQRAISKAEREGCGSILMLINTPGGSLQTTRMMVEEILNSNIPFLCLVHPSGAHAGSAGAIILQACHVAGAMVATNIGAATPVASTGQEIPEDMRKKLLNDTRSWLEGITKLRGRDLKFAQEIVTEAKAVDAKEALKIGAIDFVAEKMEDFLSFSQKRKVRLSESAETEVVVGPLKFHETDLRTEVLALIGDPQIAYLMFMGSLALIYFELTHPGTFAPGVIGGIGLVLSLISMHKLNVEWGAVALIVLGLLLLIAEAFVPSFGALGIGGIAAFVLGSVFLFDPETSGHSLPLTLILPTAFVMGLALMGVAYLAFQTRRVRKRGEYEELIGQNAKVVEVDEQSPQVGLVELHGETWRVESTEPLKLGETVNVVNHRGLTLQVNKTNR